MHTAKTLAHNQVEENLYRQFGEDLFVAQSLCDKIPTLWVGRSRLFEVLQFLKPSFPCSTICSRSTSAPETIVRASRIQISLLSINLLSMERNEDMRIKVALSESDLTSPHYCDLAQCQLV